MSTYPIIGMSPGNSYFKDEIVEDLLKDVIERYGKTAILVADVPAISTYIALGYPENRARRDKALPQGNNLKNKVRRAIQNLGYSEDKVKIIDWKDEIENDPLYKEEYKKIFKLYTENNKFKTAVNNTTKDVLNYSGKETYSSESEAVKIAAHYLLSEFAFLEFASVFLSSQKVVYIYHKNWPVYESYIEGEFDGKKRNYLGFEMVIVSE